MGDNALSAHQSLSGTVPAVGRKPSRGHQTQWAAQFAVASELCKRSYEVSFTMGNTTPVADLMVVSPETRQMFLIDVKGLYRRNAWLVRPKAARANLFYILAYVPTAEPNQFFVLTQEEIATLVAEELARLGRGADYSHPGFLWRVAEPHRDRWDKLPL